MDGVLSRDLGYAGQNSLIIFPRDLHEVFMVEGIVESD